VRSGTHTYQPFESDFLSNFTLPRHSIQRNFIVLLNFLLS